MSLFGRRGPTDAELKREDYIKKNLTTSLADATRHLQLKYVSSDEPIGSTDAANAVCHILEAMLLHGLKSSFSSKVSSFLLTGGDPTRVPQPSCWEFLQKLTHKDVISQLNHLGQITTEIGMCRAWVRLALNDGLFESYLDAMKTEKEVMRHYYKRTAYLRDAEHPGIMRSYVQGLLNLNFKLSYNSSVLNQWGSTALMLAGITDPVLERTAAAVTRRESDTRSARSSVSSVHDVAEELGDDTFQSDTKASRAQTRKSAKARIVASIGYHGNDPGSIIPSPPANTPFDVSGLTRNDIDEIRQLAHDLAGASESTSTATSQISHPDPSGFAEAMHSSSMIAVAAKRKRRSNVTSPDELSVGSGASGSQLLSSSGGSRKRSVLAGYKAGTLLSTTPEDPNYMEENLGQPEVTGKTPLDTTSEEASPAVTARSSPFLQRKASPAPTDPQRDNPDSSLTNSPSMSKVRRSRTNSPMLQGRQSGPSSATNSPALTRNRRSVTSSPVMRTPEPGTSPSASSEVTWLECDSSNGGAVKSEESNDGDSFTTALSEEMLEPETPGSLEPEVLTRNSRSFSLAQSTQPLSESASPVYNASRRSSLPPELGIINKSQPLAPVETHVTAVSTFVELGTEARPSMILPSSRVAEDLDVTPDPSENMDQEDDEYYSRFPRPVPQSNSLGSGLGLMRGWSSDFEVQPAEPLPAPPPYTETDAAPPATDDAKDRTVSMATNTTGESFDDLLQNYNPATGRMKTPSMSKVLEDLPDVVGGLTSSSSYRQPKPEGIEESLTKDFEVLPASLATTVALATDARSQTLESILGTICNEQGLDVQNYQCQGCSRPVGIIYGKARVCVFDACYYCYECHENMEYYIPSRILHNWDFRKHPVANHTLKFLRDIEDRPVLDVEEINPKIYDHADEMAEVLRLRTQLRYLKAYLFTCKQSVADDLKKQLWPKDYLYEELHKYSLQDLLNVATGQLASVLKKVLKNASGHVYDCRLCSQKGFICELCHSPKVIYPFEIEATVNCERCNAVFHKACKTELRPCPKCQRRMRRRSSLSANLDTPQGTEYAFVPAPEGSDPDTRMS